MIPKDRQWLVHQRNGVAAVLDETEVSLVGNESATAVCHRAIQIVFRLHKHLFLVTRSEPELRRLQLNLGTSASVYRVPARYTKASPKTNGMFRSGRASESW